MSALSPGRLLYLLYHRPRTWLEETMDRRRSTAWDVAMREAARNLAPLGLPAGNHLPPVRFLTGHRFAHQTAFCAYSFCWHLRRTFPFEFYDDGSLDAQDAANLLRLFPEARIVTAAERNQLVARRFPKSEYPTLVRMRDASPLMFKLVDLRAGHSGPSLYLDSDMLFFKPATALLRWLESPSGPIYMRELQAGYVAPQAQLAERWGSDLPRDVNSGLIAIDDHLLDWNELEHAASRLTTAEQSHPWAEQTLTAWILARMGGVSLPIEDYKPCSNRTEASGPPPILRHYLFKSKMPYVQSQWKDCLALIRSEQSIGRH